MDWEEAQVNLLVAGDVLCLDPGDGYMMHHI